MKNLPISIEVHNLTKIYGKTKAIDNISFSVETGQVVGFLGPNGAGKSTTLRILCGLIPATSGSARILNIPLALDPLNAKKAIGFMPENNPLPEEVRVIEYLKYRAKIKGVPQKNLKYRIDRAMDLCDLSKTTQRKIIRNLSKGYRQRVGIADCLLANPSIIIMDEPTIGLDPHQLLGIRELISNLKGEVTILISSHILPEIEHSCDRAIIINRGHIVAEGTSETLRQELIPFSTYKISIKGPKDSIISKLKQIDNTCIILNTRECDPLGFFDIYLKTEKGQQLGTHIISCLSNEPGIVLREVNFCKSTLEDIFIAATQPALANLTPSIKAQHIEPALV